MLEIQIKKSVIQHAKKRMKNIQENQEVGKSKFSSEAERIFIGYIGEKIILDFLNIKESSETFDFDIISKKGAKLEVKTITCKFKPKPHYWCTVNSHNLNGVHKQDADYYIFLRILNNLKKGWILGWISCEEFFKKGKFIKKGTDFGKFQFVKANATILPINELQTFKN